MAQSPWTSVDYGSGVGDEPAKSKSREHHDAPPPEAWIPGVCKVLQFERRSDSLFPRVWFAEHRHAAASRAKLFLPAHSGTISPILGYAEDVPSHGSMPQVQACQGLSPSVRRAKDWRSSCFRFMRLRFDRQSACHEISHFTARIKK